jgi:hypothetical protein
MRLCAHTLYAAPDNCCFLRTTAIYLNDFITPEGLAGLPSRVAAVEAWPVPTSLKELQKFLDWIDALLPLHSEL